MTETARTLQPREGAGEDLISTYKHLKGKREPEKHRESGCFQWCLLFWHWAQTETQKVLSEPRGTLLYCECDLIEAAQKGCIVSILGDTQKPPGHSPGDHR